MNRFKTHLSKQIDRWLADKAELEEALIDIDAGRIAGVSRERRAALEESIWDITKAISRLDAFVDERPRLKIVP